MSETLLGNIYVPSKFAAGYDGASHNRKRVRSARVTSRAQDEDRLLGRYDRETLRLECINLRRNHAVVAGACERFADNVVGPEGITPQAKTSSPEWNDAAEELWAEWSKIVDYAGRSSMREIQRLAIQSRIHSGEVGFVLLANGQLQAIESERIETPEYETKSGNVIDGVRVSPQSGRPVGYYVCNRGDGGYVDKRDATEVNARDFIHVYCPLRFDQLRGTPSLSPVINTLVYHGDLTESVLRKARINAKRSAVISTQAGSSTTKQLGPRNVTAATDDSGNVYEDFGEDMLTYYLRQGESVNVIGDDAPGANYIDHNVLLLKLVGAALSIPYQFLVMDFGDGSLGSNRVALLQTYRTFENWQQWLIDRFLQRLWNWRIAKAIKAGELPPAPVDARGFSEWYKVAWVGPEFSWIDPQKEAAANLAEFKLGISSITSFARKRGKDGEDVMREKAKDIATAQRIAGEVNATEGTQLTWRDIIDIAQPGQTAPSSDPQPGSLP